MRNFMVIWVGQVLSLLGTAVSNFGLTIWAYEASGGQATPLTTVGFFFVLPMVIFSPIAGVLVDRFNRKVMMMLSDFAAALTTLIILVLHTLGKLEIWHLYVTAFIGGTFQGFHFPAYSAAITTMLDKKHYARAHSMLGIADSAAGVVAPTLAGALIGPLGLRGLLIIDLVTAVFAITILFFARIPQPQRTETGRQARGNILQESGYGFRYIFARPSLLGLQTVFLCANFFFSLAFAVIAPLILGRTHNNELMFGSIQSAFAIGGLVGGVVMSIWGGPKRRIYGLIFGLALTGIPLCLMGAGQSLPVWIGAAFLLTLLIPMLNSSSQAIWQSKVPPDVQGRVFAARSLIAQLVAPFARLISGPLADRVFEPAMQESGVLAPIAGKIVGVGPGAGIGLMYVLAGICAVIIPLIGYTLPFIRNVESLIPDHDAATANVEKE
ncbi:MAG: MFS transporter [Anaerolineae bacterium]|nr:MFS transporter [Anaerolineae bacterium]